LEISNPDLFEGGLNRIAARGGLEQLAKALLRSSRNSSSSPSRILVINSKLGRS